MYVNETKNGKEEDVHVTELVQSDEESDSDDNSNSNDMKERLMSEPFSQHFEVDIEDHVITKLASRPSIKAIKTEIDNGIALHYPSISESTIESPVCIGSKTTLENFWVKPKLCENWKSLNQTIKSDEIFTRLQKDLFPMLNSYQDLYYCLRDFNNSEEIRRMYCLHALNHILKTRSKILKNNGKIAQSHKEKKELPGEFRDQGLTRPKVLIIVPFRDSALKIVDIFINLLAIDGECQVMNRRRFFEKFSKSEEGNGPQNKSDDFKKMFDGNSDDFFRVGLTIMRKTIKLYAEFYSADIIIASPVGLRSIIGANGEKRRDYDFLSSIEVLIMDQVDVFLMQNWEHVQHIFEHLHLQPKDSHDVDFSRVRMWNLNGWSKYYRQTILFSSFASPEMNFIFNKECLNYAGKTKVFPENQAGSVCEVVAQIPQVYHKVIVENHKCQAEKRFMFLVNKIFPDLKSGGGISSHTAIFISSYFDFVRIRNYLKKQEVNFLQLSEYTSRANITKSRNEFFQGKTALLLFTERFYFYYRYRIRGIKNIVFYELPSYSQFYPEIVNYMDTTLKERDINASNCTVLYSKFDVNRLSAIVGTLRCQKMIASEQSVHMFVSGQ
ncbi:U3 small nucleolar RNA-associated protein 25 homolog isoform X2 [Xenia sp. Carnegie-2017]|uniref:U3 small nucleolar RNA-associated protein 25 homolog isoform X2 n=1 Tax=Xenia sp. Carnegie-2017 TaxID=2897299 RepID=UPI001F03E8C3|nr:U3 small nucleolar RNA-associated protein 25 homolog isoform X2 [Xenia sp. Carnegie-2017]